MFCTRKTFDEKINVEMRSGRYRIYFRPHAVNQYAFLNAWLATLPDDGDVRIYYIYVVGIYIHIMYKRRDSSIAEHSTLLN